jgi:transposase-like protein
MARRTDSGRAAFWRELIERRRRSGLSVAEVCEQAGVSTPSFYQWQRKLRGRGASGPGGHTGRPAASRLIPVRIVADQPSSSGPAAGLLEVELPGGIKLRVPRGCDAATLRLVFDLVRADGSQEAG